MKRTSFIVALLLVLQLVLPLSALANGQTIIYTPIGDSLASGVNEKNELGMGYADFVAQSLQAEGATTDYTKLYTCPGYKTLDVLRDVQNNIADTNCPYKMESTELIKLQERIAQSNVITISAGANDVLKNITIDELGQPVINLVGAFATMEEIPKNYRTLLTIIRDLNPNVEIIVVGFYNPFPHLTQYKAQIDGLVAQLDTILATTVQEFKAKYVVVRDLIAANTASYLPNPENIHLSEAGYRVVADAMKPYIDELLSPKFNDVAADHWAAEYITTVAKAGVMNGSNDNFQPGAPLKRIHVASMLTRMYNYKATEVAPFTDIVNLAPVTRQELDAAYSKGIVRGSNNQFSPQANIQRVQLASMLLRAYENETGKPFVATKPLPFTDTTNLSTDEQRAISFLYENNIVSGTTPTTFAPRANTTRAAAAKIFAGILVLK